MTHWKKISTARRLVITGVAILAAASLALFVQNVFAQVGATKDEQPSPLHPTFAMLDENGVSVIESGEAVSTLKTCGQCHDTEFITSHSYHSDAGLGSMGMPGQETDGMPWDSSDGLFGKWDPLLYRYLTVTG